MGKYMSKRKRSREEVVELESTTPTSTAQKRTLGLGESEMTASLVRLLAVANSGDSTCDSSGSDNVSASCCSSNRSNQLAEGSTDFVDLEEENEEFLATSGGELEERRETTPSSEAQAELGELESTATPRESNSRPRSISAQKMPSQVELEEFFSAAETKLHKQFMDKYNYDVLKDEPLVGRYEWVRIPVKP